MPTRKRNDLTARFLRSILDYDPETGIFRWRERTDRAKNWNTRWAGKPAGAPCGHEGQVQIRLGAALYSAHRLAWLHVTGRWPRDEIDHRNGDPRDNRLANLREATRSENMRNRHDQTRAASGYRGVRYREHHRKWEARIVLNREVVWHAYFGSAQEAAAARREKLTELYGDFAPRA